MWQPEKAVLSRARNTPGRSQLKVQFVHGLTEVGTCDTTVTECYPNNLWRYLNMRIFNNYYFRYIIGQIHACNTRLFSFSKKANLKIQQHQSDIVTVQYKKSDNYTTLKSEQAFFRYATYYKTSMRLNVWTIQVTSQDWLSLIRNPTLHRVQAVCFKGKLTLVVASSNSLLKYSCHPSFPLPGPGYFPFQDLEAFSSCYLRTFGPEEISCVRTHARALWPNLCAHA